jgi:hypothetical protein
MMKVGTIPTTIIMTLLPQLMIGPLPQLLLLLTYLMMITLTMINQRLGQVF